ncbi:MAG TPA: transketolase C-terminal domain-containing protein [Bacteroidia bacterium]|nr:transketolase C-terminal domain-containing protein [Bacteroidia bacterium]
MDAILASVTKTNRCVIVEEDWPYCGMGAGVADRIYRAAFDELDAPIGRVTAKDAPIPYFRKFQRIAEEVLKNLPHLSRYCINNRKIPFFYDCMFFTYNRIKIM